MSDSIITASDWVKGIFFSILASLIGGASKLAIRYSWLMVQKSPRQESLSSHAEQHTSLSNTGHHNDRERTISFEFEDSVNKRIVEQRNGLVQRDEVSGGRGLVASDVSEQNDESSSRKARNKLAIALRLMGMFGMTFLNPFFCVLAMNYASPSILAPFSGLTLVWIVLFSEFFIGERPGPKQIFAAILIVSGEVIVAIWGDHTNGNDKTLEDLKESYENPYFQMYLILLLFWMLVLACIIVKHPTATLRRFSWGVAGGSITGPQNFLKDSLTIIKNVETDKISFPWYFYLMISCAMITAFSGLLLLTACMKRYDATFSSAMFVASFVISASVMSAVHYQTFQNLDSIWNFIMYPTGLLVLIVGVLILVKETNEDDDIHYENADHFCLGCNRTRNMRYPLVTGSREQDSKASQPSYGLNGDIL